MPISAHGSSDARWIAPCLSDADSARCVRPRVLSRMRLREGPFITPCATARRASSGFTLLEMLVVLMIAGLLIAVVALAPSRNRRTDLNEEAQRLATLLESADDEAQVRSTSIAWEPVNGGYRFFQRTENGKWLPLADDVLGPHSWGTDVTGVSIRYTGGAGIQRVVFGEESIEVPVTITLQSGAVSLRVVGTGIGNFAVQRP